MVRDQIRGKRPVLVLRSEECELRNEPSLSRRGWVRGPHAIVIGPPFASIKIRSH